MPFTIAAEDNQFGTATGTNVNSGGTTSTFDGPPSDSTDLLITTLAGDAEPRYFEIGDTYDLTFTDGDGVTHVVDGAVVLRSDSVGSDGGVVVFEGQDQYGDTVQVVWTPNVDTDAWYDNATSGGGAARFYTTDQDASYTHGYVCFAEEARITTTAGALPAGEVRPGQRVLTLDAGLREVTWIGRQTLRGHGKAAPVVFDPGAIGNDRPLRLSQQHRVLVRTPLAELMFGASEVLAPAKALVNGRDIRIRPCATITYVHLLLDSHQILRAEGALCESLLLGDMACDLISLPEGLAARTAQVPARRILRYHEAIALAGTAQPVRAADVL
ncbi:MAG: Hint domain-containing protein [Rhodobacteraceae bacterium]|nr:MAG: Hint domain-containing protein [Paracoccaceae bacterium]